MVESSTRLSSVASGTLEYSGRVSTRLSSVASATLEPSGRVFNAFVVRTTASSHMNAFVVSRALRQTSAHTQTQHETQT